LAAAETHKWWRVGGGIAGSSPAKLEIELPTTKLNGINVKMKFRR
jgi:hypothetical protein